MLLMFEKRIRGGICQATRKYAKANNKYVNNYDESKESLYLAYLVYLDANNEYGSSMLKNLPVGKFKWIDDFSKFNEEFIKFMTKIVI